MREDAQFYNLREWTHTFLIHEGGRILFLIREGGRTLKIRKCGRTLFYPQERRKLLKSTSVDAHFLISEEGRTLL